MPLAGGATDKIGNRYESRWTVFCLIDVMDEKADSIRLEPPGAEGKGVEFWLRRGDKREYHQVKRQNQQGHWTLHSLENSKFHVLSDFWFHLKNPDATCVFVSTQSAGELQELAKRARDAGSLEKFKKEFQNQDLSGKLYTLCQKWNNCSEKDAHEALKRIRVKTTDEDSLVDGVENRLATLVEGDPKTIRIELAEFALNKIHQELTAHDIWYYLLEDRKYSRRQWNKDPHVLTAVAEANNRYISLLRDAQQLHQVIPRSETQTILQKLEITDSKLGILLVGEAGVGKSGVLLQVVETLHNQGIPILAFRVDRLEPTQLPDDVGQQLGLPGSPTNVLAAIAQKRNCVLIIDQLDAVSLASGRNPQFFECVSAMIAQAQAHPKMRIVLACRKFDLDNDYRLRRLADKDGIAERVTVSRLPNETVREVVKNLKLDSSRLTNTQIELLSVPLHLNLLAEISGDTAVNVLNFKTAKDLYDRFWERKQQKIRERLDISSTQWTKVIDTLCKYMSDRQILSAPQTIVDDWEQDARAMASEQILTSDGKKYSFFHDGFFDYAFARRFAARGQSILNVLQASEQHLFRRAQVRQILIHEREADFDQYLNDLQELLHSDTIRFHIKQLVLALLASLNDPKEEEWDVLVSLRNETEGIFSPKILEVLRDSASWFELVDCLGLVKQGLNSQREEWIDETVSLISTVQKYFPERVAELVEPFVDRSEKWNKRFLRLLGWSDFNKSRRFFDLFLRLINAGVLDEISNGQNNGERDFWFFIHELPKNHPDWACEAIRCYLNRRLALGTIPAEKTNPFDLNPDLIPYSHHSVETLIESAKHAPKAFVQYVFPFMLRIVELTARQEGDPPWYDSVWEQRYYGESFEFKDQLLWQMEAALSSLAANSPEDFATVVQQQLRYSNFETIQYLLIRSYSANGKRFADEAIDYLCEQPVRLETGYWAGQGNVHAAPYWATRKLLEATTPYCSNKKLKNLEELILNYYSNYEKSSNGCWFRGYPQFVLLDAIESSRRSQVVIQRLQELQRKFKDLKLVETSGKIEPPESIEAYLVQSPIPAEATDKMTDEQWLKAIKRYNSDDTVSRQGEDGRLAGGAYQLSNLLKTRVQKEPVRFICLLEQFTDDVNPFYFNAFLQGLTEINIDFYPKSNGLLQKLLLFKNTFLVLEDFWLLITAVSLDIIWGETVFQVCKRCHQLPQKPCGKAISWLMQKQAALPWREEAFKFLLYYALKDPDPDRELWRTDAGNGQFYYGGGIHFAGINSVRGSAACAIAKLIFADKSRAVYFLESLQQVIKDPSISVRSCAVEALIAMLNYDRDLAVKLFLKLCETEDRLLRTRTIENFLKYALQTHFEALTPTLERMLSSDLPDVVKVGARQACIASLYREEARSLAERCLSGTETHRLAAAQIFVANLRSAHFRVFCEEALVRLFHDSSEEVRIEAAKCFFRFEGEELRNYTDLVNQLVNSPAFTDGFHRLVWALERTTAKLPEVTHSVCERFVKDLEAQSDRGLLRDADTVSQLLVRVYSQRQKADFQTKCLDLMDRIMQQGAYGLDGVLAEYER